MSRTFTTASINDFQSQQPMQGAGLFVVAGFSAMADVFFAMANVLSAIANAFFAMANVVFAIGSAMPSLIMISRTDPEKVPPNGM